MLKKIDFHYYVEDLRESAEKNINEFYHDLDPDTAPRNIKLMYYYYLGSKGLKHEMQDEAIKDFKKPKSQHKFVNDGGRSIYRTPD